MQQETIGQLRAETKALGSRAESSEEERRDLASQLQSTQDGRIQAQAEARREATERQRLAALLDKATAESQQQQETLTQLKREWEARFAQLSAEVESARAEGAQLRTQLVVEQACTDACVIHVAHTPAGTRYSSGRMGAQVRTRTAPSCSKPNRTAPHPRPPCKCFSAPAGL